MEIGGYLPFSLNDYPGHPAAVVFTQGCDFRCPYCHNGELLDRVEGAYRVEDILERLRRRSGLLSGVVISGGEPTLHDDLPEFCAILRELEFRVKLDTNGSRPAMLHRLLNAGLVDYVAMDIKAPLEIYPTAAGVTVNPAAIMASIDLLSESGIPHHFRTTVAPGLIAEHDLTAIKRLLPDAAIHIEQKLDPKKMLSLLPRQS